MFDLYAKHLGIVIKKAVSGSAQGISLTLIAWYTYTTETLVMEEEFFEKSNKNNINF